MEQEHLVRTVLIVSDSTGDTGHHVAEACIEQFTNPHVRVQRIRDVRSKAAVIQAMSAAADLKAFVFYTFVKDTLRAAARESAEHYGVAAIDVIGDALESMGRWLMMTPRHKPGRVLDQDYFDRVAARDFAQQHDDGQRPEDLALADAVILGLSRSGKTPLMHTLAEYGLKAANVPIVPEVPAPEQLAQCDPNRVFVLRMPSHRLRQIRLKRLPKLGLDPDTSYVDMRRIEAEIRNLEALHRQFPQWRSVDMENRAMEEAASMILEYLGPREL